jgi:hypothetical protein
LRKSRQDDPLLSVAEVLEKHEHMLDEWVERNQPEGGAIPEENVYREVVSGETIESRPQMMALLKRIESPKIKAIMVVEPSRLSRGDLEDIGYLVKILRYSNTIVITPTYSYDLNDERDRDIFERELMQGNSFLEYQKKILYAGRQQSVAAGNYIPTFAPYGYKKITVREGKKDCPTLEPHPDEAPIVKQIFEWYRDGIGAHIICNRLDEMHVPTRTGIPWSPSSIYDMFENVHYLGKVRWNYRKTIKRVEDGQIVKSTPIAEDYLLFEGKHPAIIDQELWDAVQSIRGSLPKHKKGTTLVNPLAGILKCKCGRSMIRKTYQDTRTKKPASSRYICMNRKGCDVGSATVHAVVDKVIEVLEYTIEDFEIRIEKGEDNSADIQKQLVERLEKRLSELRDMEVKQWAEKMKSGMPDHVFKQLNDPTVAEIEDIEHALWEAKNAVPEKVDIQERVVTFKAALDALRDEDVPVKEKNKLLKACIESITYDRAKAEYRGDHTPIHLDFKLKI